MPRLTDTQRNNAIGRLRAGATQQAVATHFGVSRQTIAALWARFNNTQSVHDRPRSGRPRVTTAAQDRYIRVRHLRDRTTTATSTASQIPRLRRISDQTVRNRLREAGLLARRPVRRNALNRRHMAARLQWCRHRVGWPRATSTYCHGLPVHPICLRLNTSGMSWIDACARGIHHLRHFQVSLLHSSMSGRPSRNKLSPT
ncbi:hypothetical protein BaRGS_00015198 [Batillaria attramentaria]|uniref:Transposase Tc1-like domain-containing protein n=1 Tax=Batillaria attramentaria TaxID=370345 RepID=A0ABD0L258_9CAEN